MSVNYYNILIADDEEIEREALKMIVGTSGLPFSSIYEAKNGREALDISKKSRIDIMILDINMPNLSGLQVLEMLRAGGDNAKVIISTAYDEFAYAVKALQFGAVDFLVKPVLDENLIESLRKCIERLVEEEEKEKKITRIEDYLRVSQNKIDLDNEPDQVKQTCSYIESNYDKRIGLEEIAEDLKISKFHLSRIFKSAMDMTVIDYLTKIRMEKAKELLALTKESVKIIAFRTGFSDPNYFSLTFRKYSGLSPLQFRAKALREKE